MHDRILAEIESDGPMRFDRFMERSLYDPESGFFTAGPLRSSRDGDFVTSPEVSPWFGRLVGRWVNSVRRGDRTSLIEFGAGSGSLLGPLLEEADDGFVEVGAIERSAAARSRLAADFPRVVVSDDWIDFDPDVHVVIVANEFLDNLPARLVERTAEGWSEHHVIVKDAGLRMVAMPADEAISRWCDHHLGEAPIGRLLAAHEVVVQWIAEIALRFRSADLLLIDYGARTPELAERPPNAVVRTFREHRAMPDMLRAPGTTDITVDVNLDVVERTAAALGGHSTIEPQRAFLERFGAHDVIDELVLVEQRSAREGATMDQLAARSEAVGVRALIDPTGFGAFWAVHITVGTPQGP